MMGLAWASIMFVLLRHILCARLNLERKKVKSVCPSESGNTIYIPNSQRINIKLELDLEIGIVIKDDAIAY